MGVQGRDRWGGGLETDPRPSHIAVVTVHNRRTDGARNPGRPEFEDLETDTPGRGQNTPFNLPTSTHIPMRTKHTSNALKRHRKTFHLARRDPELWEQVKESNFLESLHEAQERASAAERRAQTSERLLEDARKQASIYIPLSTRMGYRLMGPLKQG